MDSLRSVLLSFAQYPKSTLLLVAAFNFCWVLYIVFFRRNFRKAVYQAYFFYAFMVLVWVVSNAYFQSPLLTHWGPETAKKFALLANLGSSFSIIGFYYLSLILKKKGVSAASWGLMIFLAIETIVLNLIPNATVSGVRISGVGDFELLLGKWNGVFFLTGVLVIVMSFANFIQAIRNTKEKVLNAKLVYMLFGMSLMYGSIILFLIALPALFQNYRYAWLPPFFSLADIGIVGYAILTKRFVDVRLMIWSILKALLSFFPAYALGYGLLRGMDRLSFGLPFAYRNILVSALVVFLFIRLSALLKSQTLYRYLGPPTSTELIYQLLRRLKEKESSYGSVRELEKDMNRALGKAKGLRQCHILLLGRKVRSAYPHLIEELERSRLILVTEELRFTESESERVSPLLKELESLGEVCLPLFPPSKGLSGLLLIRSEKTHLYSKSEIQALVDLNSYLSILVAEILYSSELKKEVESKTVELRSKIQERNDLLQQQSDFIAVTAHEFRTPLSIALFQIEDLLENKALASSAQDLNVVRSSLSHLRELTKKLFEVQQYDLKKVKMEKRPVPVEPFFREVFQSMAGLMEEKEMAFRLKSSVPKGTEFVMDESQIRQVLHNLLTNAYKFTPRKGSIRLTVEGDSRSLLIKIADSGKGIPKGMAQSIFNKFRTSSKGAGLGLGLYICKKIVELHQGKLWAEEGRKKGAVFCVYLESSS